MAKFILDPDQAMIEHEFFEMQTRKAEARAEREAQARQAAEAEVARLKAELERLRGSSGKNS